MSEYQHYEFLALDHPLTEKQMREVRRVSTRARITSTSFVNVYNWGDFKGDVNRFMTEYYDAFVYVANWGTHTLAFRLPTGEFDAKATACYRLDGSVRFQQCGGNAVLWLQSENEEGRDWEGDEEWMSSLAPLRADLLAGDFRCLYLGWLSGIGSEEVEKDDAAVEPPVPPGLGELSAPLQALAEFLRIDEALLDAAAEASPPAHSSTELSEDMKAWIASLPAGDKDVLLYRLTQGKFLGVQREILTRFRKSCPCAQRESGAKHRTVGQIMEGWRRRTEERQRRQLEKRAREAVRRRKAAEEARKKRLDELSRREPLAWQEVETLIRTSQPKRYDEAIRLLRDLRDLAEREGRAEATAPRVAALREKYRRRPSLIRRFDAAKL